MPYGYPEYPATVGQHIRKKRMDVALSQVGLARKWGVNIQTIRNWEVGRHDPAYRFMPRVMTFLGYDPCPSDSSHASWLKAYRRAHGLTQRQMAKRLGVDQSTVEDWEKGLHEPMGRAAVRLQRLIRESECGI